MCNEKLRIEICIHFHSYFHENKKTNPRSPCDSLTRQFFTDRTGSAIENAEASSSGE
jgi:hypothetical protein